MKYQNDFIQSILSPTSSSPSVQKVLPEITPAGKLTPLEAMEVYRNDYVSRMTDALADIYQAIQNLLPESLFHELAQAYIDQHPSLSYSLGHYGHSLSQFLSSSSQLSLPLSKEFPFLADLAAFELLFSEVFHAPIHQTLDAIIIQKIANIQETAFLFAPSCRSFHSTFPIYRIWNESKTSTYQFNNHSEYPGDFLFLYKKNQQIYIKNFHPLQFRILQLMLQGRGLGDCLEDEELNNTMSETENNPAELISELFQFIVQSGTLVSII